MYCTGYEWFGAHITEVNQSPGTRFAVWAPNAKEVCVVCDRNHWQHGGFYLNSSDEGVWTGIIPEMGSGEAYKYSIRLQDGSIVEKATAEEVFENPKSELVRGFLGRVMRY